MRTSRDGSLHGLPDPPGGVGRELEAPPVVELLHRTHQTQVALLDQVEQWESPALIPLGHGHHQPEVALRHAPAGCLGAGFDLLCQLNLVRSGQQPETADLPEVRAQRVIQVAPLVLHDLGGLGLLNLTRRVLGEGLLPELLVPEETRNVVGLGRIGSCL